MKSGEVVGAFVASQDASVAQPFQVIYIKVLYRPLLSTHPNTIIIVIPSYFEMKDARICAL